MSRKARAKEIRSIEKKKMISREVFDRKIKVWGIVAPAITALIASIVVLCVALISQSQTPDTFVNEIRSEVHYRFAAEDLEQLDGIRKEVDSILQDIEAAKAQEHSMAASEFSIRMQEADRVMKRLAAEEAVILRKYDAGFRPRGRERLWFAPALRPNTIPPVVIFVIFAVVGCVFVRRYVLTYIHKKYRVVDADASAGS